MERADIAIIGTGPGGVSAALTAKVRNKNILLIGKKQMSDKVSKAHQIMNYPGLPAVTGADMAKAFEKQLAMMEIDITDSRIGTVYAMGDYFAIQAGGEGSNKINNLSVNGSNAGTFSSANGSAYKESTVNGIYLKKGQNTVKITMSWGYFTLDYITIEKMSSSNAYTAAENLVDPYASQSPCFLVFINIVLIRSFIHINKTR